jgi:cobaltochelatase CobN
VNYDRLVVMENTPAVHNMVVCTLCSCYPWDVMGLPPTWYKMPAYRSRAVSEPRAVLAELGVAIPPEREVRVWDSSAELRYMVLPLPPMGADRLAEDDLARHSLVRLSAWLKCDCRPCRADGHEAADVGGGRYRDGNCESARVFARAIAAPDADWPHVRALAQRQRPGGRAPRGPGPLRPTLTDRMAERRRNLVVREDGRRVNVARSRGQLFVCATGCCCGRTDDGFAPVPTDLYHTEWERRRFRNVVHLTVGGCLGPCALANVALLIFDGQALWFHSVNSEALVRALYDHIEAMLDADACLPAPPALAALQFTASTWQPRPDGQLVDDHRPRRVQALAVPAPTCPSPSKPRGHVRLAPHRFPPISPVDPVRRNGELVFDARLRQGRVLAWQARRNKGCSHGRNSVRR